MLISLSPTLACTLSLPSLVNSTVLPGGAPSPLTPSQTPMIFLALSVPATPTTVRLRNRTAAAANRLHFMAHSFPEKGQAHSLRRRPGAAPRRASGHPTPPSAPSICPVRIIL